MPTRSAAPLVEAMLDIAIESTSIALLPFSLGAWVTLTWIRSFDAPPRCPSSPPDATPRK